MSNTTFFMPFGTEHNRLDKVAQGRDDVPVSMERLGELGKGEILEELAYDLYLIEKEGYGKFGIYISVEEPEELEGVHYIRKFLTTIGQAAYDALKIGWVWDSAKHDVSIEETNKLYGDMLRKGSITRHYAELIANNKDERLRELRNDLVYFKLRSKEDKNGNFIEIKDAA